MPVVLKKTNNFAVFNRTDILKKKFTNKFDNKEFQIKFKKYLPNKNEIISISNITNSNKVNTRKLKFNDNEYSEKKCKEWINNVQQKMNPNTLKKFNALLQSNMTNKNKWDIYLKNKTQLSLNNTQKNEEKLQKSQLVYNLISNSLIKYSLNELTTYISNLSQKNLLKKLDRFVIEIERYDNSNMHDENSKHIFHLTIKELYIRLLTKFKKLKRFNFYKYVQNLSDSELNYNLAYLMDYAEKNSDNNIQLYDILMKENYNRNDQMKTEYLYLITIYNNSKKEFKNYIKQLDKNTIIYHLSSISTYTKNQSVRKEIIRDLMIALKNVEMKKWLIQGWSIKDIGENIRTSEHLVDLLENSIKMNEDDFINSLVNIDIRTFLILHRQVHSGFFQNHWHHNTENFTKYFEIALRRKQKKSRELNKIIHDL